MPDDEPLAEEPTTGDRTAAERLATAGERAALETRPDDPPGGSGAGQAEADDADGADEADDADEPEDADKADNTDMSAVGDDGQVFGG